MTEISHIRNFAILAHIDHGKSTLADRMLEITHTVESRKMKEQMLDQMDLERERGITIKLQPVRMVYQLMTNDQQPTTDDRQLITNSQQTIKSAGCESSVVSRESSSTFLLNLIDTPGHVDFQYEVSRSLAAVEGAVLLVDATKGVQAQTLANLYNAIEQGLTIIPVVNKIDLPNAEVERTKKEIIHILGCEEKDILCASGKTGIGVKEILDEVVLRVSAPKGNPEAPFRALIFDSVYDDYRGVVAYIRVVDGEVGRDQLLKYFATQSQGMAIEVGYFFPALMKTDTIKTGEVGYIATGLKSVSVCRVGDTIYSDKRQTTRNKGHATGGKQQETRDKQQGIRGEQQGISDKEQGTGGEQQETRDKKQEMGSGRQWIHNDGNGSEKSSLLPVTGRLLPEVVIPLPGYREVHPVVYASFYPREGEDYNGMRDALEKLRLNDASFVFEPESNLALGRGFRCGFLGMLHLEIIQARLDREFNFSPVITTPSVVYEIVLKNGETKHIYSPVEYPDPSTLESVAEPFVKLEVITPSEYLGSVMTLLSSLRSTYKNTQYLDADRVVVEFEAPLMEVIVNFHDDLKSATSGFASMNYEVIGYRMSDLVKLDIMIAGDNVEAFSRIVPKIQAFSEGKKTVEKLKEVLPRQNFVVALQAAIGGKIIARSSITAFRKDVIAKLYGGDFSRKKKLLEKQKAGKKRMKTSGRVNIPPEAFLNVLKR